MQDVSSIRGTQMKQAIAVYMGKYIVRIIRIRDILFSVYAVL